MRKISKTLLLILTSFSLLILLWPNIFVKADSKNLPLGDRCHASHECGLHKNYFELGCRKSDLGNYKICKIVSPGLSGCKDAPAGENWCGDTMVCKNDECLFPRKEIGEVDWDGDISLPSIGDSLTLLFKIINFLLAIGLIAGLVLVLKGYMLYKTALGHEPLNHKAYKWMVIGAGIIVICLFVAWILVNLAE